MMIERSAPSGKSPWNEFAEPPWSRTSPEWLRLETQVDDNHLARLIDGGVECLDLSALRASYAGRGSKAHRPDLMLKIALFELQRGHGSPAHWDREARENIAAQWLGQGIRPSRSVWYEFDSRIAPYVDAWNRQILQQAQAEGHLPGRRGVLDGTTVEADASRHHLLHAEQVKRRRELLEVAIIAEEQGTASAEIPYWMAKTPQSRQRQREQYEKAQDQLEVLLAENRRRIPSRRKADKDVRISVTDPEAPLGKDKSEVYRPLYNVQFLRDADSPFLLAYEVFASNTDAGTLVPLMDRGRELTDRLPEILLVDGGYVTALDLADAQRLGIDLCGPWRENDYSQQKASRTPKPFSKDQFPWDEQAQAYRCPRGEPLTYRSAQNRKRYGDRTEKIVLYQAHPATCAACPLKTRCCPNSKSGRHINRSEHEPLIEAHRQKMETPEAKALYKLRKQTVETSFGDSKAHRDFRRVHGRGLRKAKTHTALTVLAHNLKTLSQITRAAEQFQQSA